MLTEIALLEEEPCILRIPRPSGGVIRIAGEFQWSQPHLENENLWRSSCKVSNDFPKAYLDEIATLGLLERRDNDRYLVCESVAAKHRGTNSTFSATVTEISAGGIRVFSDSSRTVGDELILNFDENHQSPHQLKVRVTRVTRVSRGYELGCEITSGSIDPLIAECHLSNS